MGDHLTFGDAGRGPMPDHYITGEEFERWMKHTSDSLGRIEQMQRTANSKTASHAEAIAVITRRLDEIESETEKIEDVVRSVKEDGCHQLATHEAIVRGGGEVMVTPVHPIPHPATWGRRTKMLVGAGISVAMWPAVEQIARLLYAVLVWLDTHTIR